MYFSFPFHLFYQRVLPFSESDVFHHHSTNFVAKQGERKMHKMEEKVEGLFFSLLLPLVLFTQTRNSSLQLIYTYIYTCTHLNSELERWGFSQFPLFLSITVLSHDMTQFYRTAAAKQYTYKRYYNIKLGKGLVRISQLSLIAYCFRVLVLSHFV